ncbi:MAG: hypothetical protein LBP90_01615 [Burkholderiales bacterium]|jgi:hypothetical protein|nr:hypothetical protein [Burkholderiales bacterium]
MKISKETRFDHLLLAIARKGSINALTKNAEISSSYINQFENGVIKQRQDNRGGNNVAGKIKKGLEDPTGCLEPSTGSKKRQRNTLGRMPLSFQMDGLRRLKARPKNLLAVKVIDYGMEPRLFNGNTLVIGRSDARVPTDDGVFSLVYGGEMPMERLFTLPDGVRVQCGNALWA